MIGAAIGLGLVNVIPEWHTGELMPEKSLEEPLYWVAPMDPDYRRDEPGLSPMGMELVPVYKEKNSEIGTISISPDVVNNLGVRTALVKKATLNNKIQTVGYVQYDEDKLKHIHPRVDGWLEKLYVKASGEPVKRGQPLYTIYSPALVNAQEEYLIAVKRKNDRLIKAAEDRLRSLQVPSSVIRDLKKNHVVKQSTTFYAPQSGVMTELNVREGFFVTPSTSMMSLGVIDDVWVQVEVFERQSSQVKVGQTVVMTLPYLPGREWIGIVDYIYPTLEPSTRTLKIRLKFDNSDHILMPNMFAQIAIHIDDEIPTLLLPKEAVIRTGDMNRVVLALGQGSFKSISINIGRSDDENIEVISGVTEGERIVTSAQFLLDSESSKTSDFKRMNHSKGDVKRVTVKATINHLVAEHKLLNVTHQPIKEWNRPEMTMNFKVANNVNLSMIEKGDVVNLEILEDENDELIVTEIEAQSHEHNSIESVMP